MSNDCTNYLIPPLNNLTIPNPIKRWDSSIIVSHHMENEMALMQWNAGQKV